MKYVFKNINSLTKNEPFLFAVMILCVLASAWIMTFSYGLYQNYNVIKNDEQSELSEILPKIKEGKTLSKEDAQKFLSAIPNSTLDSMDIILAVLSADEIKEFTQFDNNIDYGTIKFRFTIHDGKYQTSKYVKQAWGNSGQIASGRYFTDDEEEAGANVAMVSQEDGTWNEPTLAIKTSKDTIRLFGKEYQVIGTYKADTAAPLVPFLSIPDNLKLENIGFYFKHNVTREQYESVTTAAQEEIPDVLDFSDQAIPDSESIYLYNNIMLISALIAALTIINFAGLYHFIVRRRMRQLAVFRICGCTALRALATCLAECVAICVPIFLTGMAIYIPVMKNVFAPFFPYMEAAYTPGIYAAIFGIYVIILLFIMGGMLSYLVKKNTADVWKSGAF